MLPCCVLRANVRAYCFLRQLLMLRWQLLLLLLQIHTTAAAASCLVPAPCRSFTVMYSPSVV